MGFPGWAVSLQLCHHGPFGWSHTAPWTCALAGVSSVTEPQLQWGTTPNMSLCWKPKHSRSCVFRNKILNQISVFRGKIFPFPLRKPRFSVEKHHEGDFLSSPGQRLLRSNINGGMRNECSRSCPFPASTASMSEMLTATSSRCATLP